MKRIFKRFVQDDAESVFPVRVQGVQNYVNASIPKDYNKGFSTQRHTIENQPCDVCHHFNLHSPENI